jgi:hypothetical protein
MDNRQAVGDVWRYAPILQNAPDLPLGREHYEPMGNYELFLRDLMQGPGAVYNTMFPKQMLGATQGMPMMPQQVPTVMPQVPSYSGYGDPIRRIQDIEEAVR